MKNTKSENNEQCTRFEKARIVGARALQISFGAPVLIECENGETDPVEIALKEYDRKVIPITVDKEADASN